jgi:hypothetical protein
LNKGFDVGFVVEVVCVDSCVADKEGSAGYVATLWRRGIEWWIQRVERRSDTCEMFERVEVVRIGSMGQDGGGEESNWKEDRGIHVEAEEQQR